MMADKKILFQFPITDLAKRVSNSQVPLKGTLTIHPLDGLAKKEVDP
jgi:hypothetical protein